MNLVGLARNIAIEYHAGDRNKHDGEMYLLHVSRVASGARSRAGMWNVNPELAEAVAWLHDTVEDTVLTLDALVELLTAQALATDIVVQVVTAVDLLTKVKGQSLDDYYAAIKPNKLARCVKLADMQDNFSRNHKIVDEATKLRMSEKYSKGMAILG